jgi:hypothetical protein
VKLFSRGFCSFLLFVAVLACSTANGASANRELIVCGWDEVYILDLDRRPAEKVWSWKAAESAELPEAMRTQFRTTDECKSADGGKRILITASSDGIALVDRATRKVLFYGSVGGAHSAQMLPGGLIAVAGSTSKSPLANRLVLFDSKRSGQPLFDTELVSGHGVVWDRRREVLWALGLNTLRTYKLTKRQLIKTAEYALPDSSGHDLMAVPNTDLLSVTTHHHAWMFDRTTRKFSPHPQLPDLDNVKSINVHPETGEVVWTLADKGFWWTATLRFLNPESTIERTGERLYKARWVAPAH